MTRPPDPDSLVLLTVCADSPTGAVLRATLDAAGIPALLQAEQHRALLGPLGPYVEPRVLVKRSDLEQAREVLGADPLAPDEGLARTSDTEDLAWSERLRHRRRFLAIVALLLFLHPVTGDFILGGLLGGDLLPRARIPMKRLPPRDLKPHPLPKI